jgi:hypothetical protein
VSWRHHGKAKREAGRNHNQPSQPAVPGSAFAFMGDAP